jgi:hypothetical protein
MDFIFSESIFTERKEKEKLNGPTKVGKDRQITPYLPQLYHITLTNSIAL